MPPTPTRDRLWSLATLGIGLACTACVVWALRDAPAPADAVPPAPDVAQPPEHVATTHVATTHVVDERVTSYFEDEDGRPVARMTARLLRAEGGVRMEYRASAFSPEIEPPPGAEGVPGSNQTTAREIDALLASGSIRLRLEDLDRAAHTDVQVVPGAKQHVPLRTVGPDGRIDFRARSREHYRSAFRGLSGVLPDGRYQLRVESDGRVRAQCRFVVRDGGGKILQFEGVRHPRKRSISDIRGP